MERLQIQHTKDLGRLAVGKEYNIVFNYTVLPGFTLVDVKVATSCACSLAGWNQKEKAIIIKYKPAAVPMHLRKQNFYSANKKAIAEFKFSDGHLETVNLSFNGTVYGLVSN